MEAVVESTLPFSFDLASVKRPTLYYDMTLEDYQSQLFRVEANKALQDRIAQGARDLAIKGYCVIKNVVEHELCDYAHASLWRTLEGASNGRLKHPTCAADLKDFVRGGNWPINTHGIFEHPSFAHLDFVHAVRTHPAVANIFAHFYGADRGLIVAPDRINYQLPNEWVPRARFDKAWTKDPDAIQTNKEATWVHVDQSFAKRGLHCVQGLVVMIDADQPGDASLEVVSGSHLMHRNMEAILEIQFPKAEMRAHDWYMFNDTDKELLQAMGFFDDFNVVHAKKGDFIAWDSRAVHQGGRIRAHAVHAPRPNPTPRFVVYVCMQPAWEPLTDAQVKKKKKIFTELRSTSHWPLQSKMFGASRTYPGKEPPEFDFSKYVVEPLVAGNDNKFQVLKEFAGITQQRALRLAPFNVQPLLSFDPSSGMRPHHTIEGFSKRKRVTDDGDDEKKEEKEEKRGEISNIEEVGEGNESNSQPRKRRRVGLIHKASTPVNSPVKRRTPTYEDVNNKWNSKRQQEELAILDAMEVSFDDGISLPSGVDSDNDDDSSDDS